MMKILITDDSPANLAGLSRCALSFDPEHLCSVVTKLYKAGLHDEAGFAMFPGHANAFA